MFKTILAFIRAHTVATAITATVVVSTAVATPIIINQTQKPKQEIETGQVQENIVDNTVIDNTVEENETPDENVIDDNTLEENTNNEETPKEENKQETKNNQTTKPTISSTNTSTTKPTTNNNKTETPTETVTSKLPSKYVYFGTLVYDEANKEVNSTGFYTREQWLSSVYAVEKSQLQKDIETARTSDTKAKSNKDYVRNQIQWCKSKIAGCKEAYYWYQEHKDEVVMTDQNTFLYKGLYYEGNQEVLYGQWTKTYPEEIKILERDYLPNYPEIGPQEEQARANLQTLEKAYSYIKSH